jgi:NAD(P)-dependent dehydrogenase (short-subunit alcohol dehydrogenase family)
VGVYCVTGAASGLGRALTERLKSDGHQVIAVDLHSVEIAADLSSPGGRAAAVSGVLDRCGGVLDGLVPCAGIGPQHPSEKIVAINYFGAIALLDGLTDALAADAGDGVGAGAAVMICSNATTLTPGANGKLTQACIDGGEPAALAIAFDTSSAVAYAASKVAIARAMRRRARSLGERGVRVNAVAPGPFMTPLLQEGLDDPATSDLIQALPIPLGRMGEPDDIADVVAWLLYDGSRYVHGSTLFVDGGIDAMLSPDRFP